MNTALKRLGYDEKDRVLIMHADDVGMCQATITAWMDCLDAGLVSSAATMVPCPWFPQTAAICREHPDVDMGVHLTVNCEWDNYRWRPVSTCDPASGLIDDQGYFHQWHPAIWDNATVPAATAEMQAQIRLAKQAGIDPTHADTHMLTLAHPRFSSAYVEVAQEHRLPVSLSKNDYLHWQNKGIPDELIARHSRLLSQLDNHVTPVIDQIIVLPLDDPTDHVAVTKRYIDNLQPGLTVMLMHPAADTPELRAIAPDWQCRVANYQAMTSRDLKEYVAASGVQVIGYRPLRDLVRARA